MFLLLLVLPSAPTASAWPISRCQEPVSCRMSGKATVLIIGAVQGPVLLVKYSASTSGSIVSVMLYSVNTEGSVSGHCSKSVSYLARTTREVGGKATYSDTRPTPCHDPEDCIQHRAGRLQPPPLTMSRVMLARYQTTVAVLERRLRQPPESPHENTPQFAVARRSSVQTIFVSELWYRFSRRLGTHLDSSDNYAGGTLRWTRKVPQSCIRDEPRHRLANCDVEVWTRCHWVQVCSSGICPSLVGRIERARNEHGATTAARIGVAENRDSKLA